MQDDNISVFIGLGSNQGNLLENLIQAQRHIKSLTGVLSLSFSTVYYTEPQGVKDQPWFANQVLQVQCASMWTPVTFLKQLHNIESYMGRKRESRWGPRVIDLDILLFGHEVWNTADLIIPHPRMFERAFVLVPLLELDTDIILPDGQKASEALNKLQYSVQGQMIWQEQVDKIF